LRADCRSFERRYAETVGEERFVHLDCAAETLVAVESRLRRFGPAGGAPQWLVSGVWLCTDEADYIATASAEVLDSGFVAWPLSIHRPADLVRQIQSELPNVSARLIGRNGNFDLSVGQEAPDPPPSLAQWPCPTYSAHVLVRVSQRQSITNRVACALLMKCPSAMLLVGTDPSMLAMVLSEDPTLIERYRADCEALTPAEYLSRCED
jgi:hypothetical protein